MEEKDNLRHETDMLTQDINKLFEITNEHSKQQARLEANLLSLSENVDKLSDNIREGNDSTQDSIKALAENLSQTNRESLRPNYQLIAILLTGMGMLSTFGGAFLSTVGWMALESVNKDIDANTDHLKKVSELEYDDRNHLSQLSATLEGLQHEQEAHRQVFFRQADWHTETVSHQADIQARVSSLEKALDEIKRVSHSRSH